ncbi:MAG: OmpP1/FadL family transporter [Pseudomonadales bacterium]
MSITLPHRSTALLALLTVLPLTHTWAGGLWISEFGAPAMGRAGAGAEAGVNDASTGLYNPASMTRLDTSQFMATGGFAWSQIEFESTRTSLLTGNEDGGDAGSVAPAASAFYVRPLNERWWFGMNFYGVTGSALDYKNNWVGRFQATDVELVFLGLQPTIGYKVNDHLSIGAGVLLGYTKMELTVAVPNLTNPLTGPPGSATVDGDDTEIGFTLGAMLTLSPNTRLGLIYQSDLDSSYSGDVELSPSDASVGVDADLPLAALARLALTHQFNPNLAAHLTVGWEDWDTLDALLLTTESAGVVAKRNWDDTYHYAGGISYRLSDQWAVQGGVSYDTNPADKEFRTADLPVDRQVRYAIGGKYTRASGAEIAAHLVYADYGRSRIDSTGFAGDYKSNDIVFFSVSYNWGKN